MAHRLLWIGLAGAAGALARYGVALAVQRGTHGFPWATLLVNAVGCFAFGLVVTLGAERGLLPIAVETVVLVGFIGAFTTFSTFGYETAAMLRDGHLVLAGANVLAQNGLGVVAVLLGVGLGRWV